MDKTIDFSHCLADTSLFKPSLWPLSFQGFLQPLSKLQICLLLFTIFYSYFLRCKIYFYLEDDSIQVIEPKLQNSGIPQGKFIMTTFSGVLLAKFVNEVNV